jgi:hypothetical protein
MAILNWFNEILWDYMYDNYDHDSLGVACESNLGTMYMAACLFEKYDTQQPGTRLLLLYPNLNIAQIYTYYNASQKI